MSTTITIPFKKGKDGTYEIDKTSLPTEETGEGNLTPIEWDQFCDQVETIFQPMHDVESTKFRCACFSPALTLFFLIVMCAIVMFTVDWCEGWGCALLGGPLIIILSVLFAVSMVCLCCATPYLYYAKVRKHYSKVIEDLEELLKKESGKREGVSFQVESQCSPKWCPKLERDYIKCIVSVPTHNV